MQRLVEKALALATQFDDDGAIDFFIFDSKAAYLGEISIDDFAGSVDRLTKGRRMGSTNYADAFLTIRDHFGFAPAAPPRLDSSDSARPSPADRTRTVHARRHSCICTVSDRRRPGQPVEGRPRSD